MYTSWNYFLNLQAIQALGLVIYQALDYGLGDNEERHLGRDLEHLLELMINPDEEDETCNADDEGIEKDAKEGCTFQEISVVRPVFYCLTYLEIFLLYWSDSD